MTAGDSTNARENDLVKRLTVVVIFIVVFTAAFAHLHRLYADKFFGITGRAEWIWAQHRMSSNEPVAFFAAREFVLPERRDYTHLKVIGDPEYAIHVNGREIAGRRLVGRRKTSVDERLSLYDISQFVKTGRNRIVITVRAPAGIGGLIAALDLAPENQNWLVTNADWKIYRQWHPLLFQRDPPGLSWESPQIVGAPPIGRWNYLQVVRRETGTASPPATAAEASFDTVGLVPGIRTRGGVAVAVADRSRATAFDFGFTRGQLRLTRERSHFASRTVNVRFAFARHELGYVEWNLRPVVFAPGEMSVTTPEAHDFRYAMVFARGVRADVVRATARAIPSEVEGSTGVSR
jgi:hypothetical protein